MRSSLPILGIVMAALLAFGAGCAEDDGFFVGGSGGGRKTASPTPTPGSGGENPTPTPSGSGFTGGIH